MEEEIELQKNRKPLYTIEDMQKLARERGGKCLSKHYIKAKTKLLWECEKGHQWENTPSHIKRGQWCPYCAVNKKGTLEEMHEIAKSRKGKCLSQKYTNSRTKLMWECEKGHQWEAIPSNIKKGQWCPDCAVNREGTLEEMHEIAKSRKGKCLAEKYINDRTKLLWECEKEHQWDSNPSDVKRGRWCPYCAGKRITIEDIKKVAEKRNGKCLSDNYINIKTKLLWQCSQGHKWEAVYDSVKRGGWCPYCSINISERICRYYFEKIFNKKFPKIRPEWLVSSRGALMELDGYNIDLRIAFEYQGIQHYEEIDFFHDNRSFEDRKADEILKRQLCKESNVSLIEVPYTVSYEKMGDYIVSECEKRNIFVNVDIASIDYKKFPVYSLDKLKEMSKLAKSRNGKCLSKQYINSKSKLLWECQDGHQWLATPSNIKTGYWCPDCAGNKKATIEEMHDIAKSNGGKCLSKKYVNDSTKLLWECKKGHKFESRPSDVKRGKWCAVCASCKKLTIEEMIKIAKSHEGKCLSKEYVNSKTKLLWECKKGHKFESRPSDVKRGKWCSKCAKNKKGTIEEMYEIAQSHKGKCLSEKYVNARTSLLWECEKGHQWQATPDSIKRGSWCRKCTVKHS